MTPARLEVTTGSGPSCADSPELMFPLHESQRPGQPTAGERAAQAVCAGCPLLATCRAAVLDTQDTAPMANGVAGGMTAAERRAVRAYRRGLSAPPVPAPREPGDQDLLVTEPGRADASARSAPGVDVDAEVADVLAAHAGNGHGADPVTVRELVLDHGPAMASRWETALAAVVMLGRGQGATAIGRALGDDPTQITRWRDRHAAGEALVRGGAGVGTRPLARPARLVAGSLAGSERGAA
jgi:hypothetical protein